MRNAKLCALLLVAFCYFALPQRAEAARGLSSVSYDSTFNVVSGYSETSLSFIESYYYDAVVDAYLYDQYGTLRDQGYSEGGSTASVNTYTQGNPGVRFDLFSDHYVVAYFYYCDYYCDSPRYYDGCGFSLYPWDTFYGYYYEYDCYYVCYVFWYYIYLGTTGDSVTVPQPCPNVRVELHATFGNYNEVINDQTKSAMVGAMVQVEALAILPDGEVVQGGGNFQWSASGDARVDNTFNVPYIFRVWWPSEGQKKITVKFTPPDSSCQVSASVNINNTIPEFVSFSAVEYTNEINAGANCSDLQGITYTLRCLSNTPGFRHDPGMVFTASFRPPPDCISAPADSKLKFVQLVNPFVRQMERGAGDFECQTTRLSEFDTSTGWMLDGSDPYSIFPPSLLSFANTAPGTPLTIMTDDSPGTELDGPHQTLDYFYANDQFEMYVVYFVGAPSNPLVSRVLAKLPWNWGGDVSADPTLNPPYRENFSLVTPGTKPGFSSIYIQTPHQGIAQNLPFGTCPGAEPDPTPDPDPCLRKPWLCDNSW